MDSLPSWLALREVEGLGIGTCSRLVLHFGSPEAVRSASLSALTEQGGISLSLAKKIREPCSPSVCKTIEREQKALEQQAFAIVTILDPAYPTRLRMIADPPPFLYLTGQIESCHHPALAIVGSRKATPTGCAVTKQLSEHLAALGFTIVSGLARGIDAAAHRGALNAGGSTIAVLGSGIDRTYPPEHRALRRQIQEKGAVLSEFPLGSAPRSYHFPRRNRIIAGLALGVVVTEAASKSGSLITARLALEYNREVFAVPGQVTNPLSRGPHRLIKEGGKLVETHEDIIEELLPQLESPFRERLEQRRPSPGMGDCALSPEEETLLSFFSLEPISLETVLSQCGFTPAEAMSLLLSLEIKGLIRQLPGTQYILNFVR